MAEAKRVASAVAMVLKNHKQPIKKRAQRVSKSTKAKARKRRKVPKVLLAKHSTKCRKPTSNNC